MRPGPLVLVQRPGTGSGLLLRGGNGLLRGYCNTPWAGAYWLVPAVFLVPALELSPVLPRWGACSG